MLWVRNKMGGVGAARGEEHMGASGDLGKAIGEGVCVVCAKRSKRGPKHQTSGQFFGWSNFSHLSGQTFCTQV